MKLRKRKLFSSIAFVLSLVMLAVSGAVFVHTATQQSATSSLSVTFSGENVNYEVQGWYQVHGGNRAELVDNDLDNDNIVTFFATEPPTEKTLKISNTEVNNKAVLTSEHPYVLFTYKFTNTASEGAFGMEVSLNMSSITNSNLKAVKYGTDTTLYTEANLESTISSKVTNTASSTTIFDDDFIVAGKTGPSDTSSIKYYYILLEINDLTLPVTFNPSFDWDVECSDSVEEAIPTATISMSCYRYEDNDGGVVQAYYQEVDRVEDILGYDHSEFPAYDDSEGGANSEIEANCRIFNAPVSVQAGKYFAIFFYNIRFVIVTVLTGDGGAYDYYSEGCLFNYYTGYYNRFCTYFLVDGNDISINDQIYTVKDFQ